MGGLIVGGALCDAAAHRHGARVKCSPRQLSFGSTAIEIKPTLIQFEPLRNEEMGAGEPAKLSWRASERALAQGPIWVGSGDLFMCSLNVCLNN